eukprot:10784626-Alexandrium_andersonii.AAC.1
MDARTAAVATGDLAPCAADRLSAVVATVAAGLRSRDRLFVRLQQARPMWKLSVFQQAARTLAFAERAPMGLHPPPQQFFAQIRLLDARSA